jgi:hypothetical protein
MALTKTIAGMIYGAVIAWIANALRARGPSGGLKSKEMEHGATNDLEGMAISAVQNTQVEGRHSDQSCRHATEHRQSISPVRFRKAERKRDLS